MYKEWRLDNVETSINSMVLDWTIAESDTDTEKNDLRSMEVPELYVLTDPESSDGWTGSLSSSSLPERETGESPAEELEKQRFFSTVYSIIQSQHFEPGFESDLDRYLKSNSELRTKDWLNEFYNNNYSDDAIVKGVLQALSHFDISRYSPNGLTMVTAAVPHKDSEVRELAIRVLENWGTLECLEILESIHVDEAWLKDYLDQVIEDLRSELKIHAVHKESAEGQVEARNSHL